ncbi:hypothetical protein TRFO_31765 [Tritrichomonas foetus]|uniref:Uncharacterized protein n=1 Tax=Tritrichomonas foetus TaxID=1144522 RepID=A0A1J4JQJ7_9EUKA|nr:hypothetical protein TRFO_31765 [Tritrichomonas foetus]|eukprot:OHT01439.1 hypothetical protein TRFO_31765 [Tritrichomonas foetus]
MSIPSEIIPRKVKWIYTTIDGIPDIIFEREGIPKADSNQPHYMRRYSPHSLSEAFRAMGCHQPLSGAMADWMFEFLRKCPMSQLSIILGGGTNNIFNNQRTYSKSGQFIILTRMQFHRLACASLHVHQFRKIRYSVDFRLALDFMEDRRFFILLLSGAPGTGKSTIASLIASRMSVNHILSTDSIRHAMRTFYPQDKYPILYKSTYECGDVIDPLHELPEKERVCFSFERFFFLINKNHMKISSSKFL